MINFPQDVIYWVKRYTGISKDFMLNNKVNPKYLPSANNYKVYTALLTQSGGDDPVTWANNKNGGLVIGVTYEIANYANGDDFTNIGAPSNANGIKFVATGTTAASWSGATELNYNNGAPIVTVLENTIGDIWATYVGVGIYEIGANGLFIEDKTFYNSTLNNNMGRGGNGKFLFYQIFRNDDNSIRLQSIDVDLLNQVSGDSLFYKTPIEIRVYN